VSLTSFVGQGNDAIYGSTRWDRMQIDDLHGGNGNDTIKLTDGDTVRGGAGAKDSCQITGTPTLIRSCEIRS